MELYNDNCLNILDKFIAEGRKVDYIITSPPYNMNVRVVENNKCSSRVKDTNRQEIHAKYENYTDDLDLEDYFDFQNEFISKALKVTDTMFYNIQMVTGNKVPLLKLMGIYAEYIKEIIIWDKTVAQPAIQEGVLNSQFEFVIVFNTVDPWYRRFSNAQFSKGTLTNIWNIPRERNDYIKAGFPQQLVTRILLNFTQEGDTILDPYMGSGTTGICCKEHKRNFIGVELGEEMFNIAKSRIETGQYIKIIEDHRTFLF